MMIPQLKQDKANHFIYGAFAAAIAVLASGIDPIVISIGASAIIGVAKEVFDSVTGKGEPSYADAVATLAGGVVVAISHIKF